MTSRKDCQKACLGYSKLEVSCREGICVGYDFVTRNAPLRIAKTLMKTLNSGSAVSSTRMVSISQSSCLTSGNTFTYDIKGELSGESYACRGEPPRLTSVRVSLVFIGGSMRGTCDVSAGVVTIRTYLLCTKDQYLASLPYFHLFHFSLVFTETGIVKRFDR